MSVELFYNPILCIFIFFEGTEELCVEQLEVLQEDFNDENQPPDDESSTCVFSIKEFTKIFVKLKPTFQ